MKKLLMPFFVALIPVLLLLSCAQSPSQPTLITETIQISQTPQLTIAITQAPTFINTPIPTPNFCPRETISGENLLLLPSETNNEKLIAFFDGVDRYDDIYIMNLNGKNRKNITNNPTVDRFPKWSPDGKIIAFLSNRNHPAPNECLNMVSNDCIFEIFLMNHNGNDMHQISKGWSLSHVWSPDSKQIAYSYFFPDPKSTPDAYGERVFFSNIYAVNVDISNLRNLTEKFQPGAFSNPVWSPDSKKIAFARQHAIVITNSDGRTEPQEYPIRDIHSILGWSADDNLLFFMDRNYDIYKASVDFSTIQRLPLQYKVFTYGPTIALSHDSKWLAYEYYSDQGITPCRQIRIFNTNTSQDYFVYDYEDVGIATTNSSIPLSAAPLLPSSINWMPDDNQLLFTQYVHYDGIFGEFQALFVINIDGTELRNINDQGEVFSPAIQP